MNNKIYYLAIIPLYGTVIVLLFLFIKTIKDEIDKKKFISLFIRCSLFASLYIIFSMLLFAFLYKVFSIQFFWRLSSILWLYIRWIPNEYIYISDHR